MAFDQIESDKSKINENVYYAKCNLNTQLPHMYDTVEENPEINVCFNLLMYEEKIEFACSGRKLVLLPYLFHMNCLSIIVMN